MFTALVIGGLASTAAAAPDDCPTRMSAEDFRAASDRAVADLAAGARPAVAELGRLMTRLTCVDGPLHEDDLGRLYLARGVSLYGKDRGQALDQMRWAANLGAEWLVGFGDSGDNMARDYTAIQGTVGAPGALQVRSTDGADVLLVDGWVLGAGEHPVADGAHLVQWRTAEGWRADWVIVASGETVQVGPEPSQARSQQEPGLSWGGVAAGMRFYRGDIYDGYQRWDGSGLSPGVRLDGRLGLRGPWFFDGGLRVGSPAMEERPPMISGADATGGYRVGDRAWAELRLGARGSVLPAVEPGTDQDAAPRFRETWRLGGAAALGLGAVDGPVAVDLDLGGALYGVGWETWGALTGGLRFESIEPIVRLSGGFIGVDAAWGRESRYDWYSAEVGMRWRLQ